ncbi:CBS domain-containing protein [Clavibacter californiensis]|uniref:CBS domain-containing protein n=1 Tax=Clavibacter californiensis TaxID=1401995 RepID=A0ABX9N1V9_9MICO|nr:CBS domain-containing protein [Clavibacter californiensis]RII89245.1 CBS domain-containing protein [Clavibacter californiensis]UKF80245.1 CBS domain-containing protein [Clavibacter californiensis]
MPPSATIPEPTKESGLAETKAYLEHLRDDGRPVLIRQLISFWGLRGRGKRQVAVVEQDLQEMGLRTEPPFDSGPLDGSVIIRDLIGEADLAFAAEQPDEHLLTLSRIGSANFAIRSSDDSLREGFVVRGSSVDDAVTIMLRRDFSQLPVVQSSDDQTLVGVFSWDTYAQSCLRGAAPGTVEKAMRSTAPVDLHSDLFASVQPISRDGFVVVTYKGKLAGIVTASDLTKEFEKLTVPFLAVGRCEQELKRVARVLLPEDPRKKVDDMMFGQLQKHYMTHWSVLGWALSKELFDHWLDATRALRNSIAHFDDPDEDRSSNVEAVHRLTQWLRNVAPGVGEGAELEGKS